MPFDGPVHGHVGRRDQNVEHARRYLAKSVSDAGSNPAASTILRSAMPSYGWQAISLIEVARHRRAKDGVLRSLGEGGREQLTRTTTKPNPCTTPTFFVVSLDQTNVMSAAHPIYAPVLTVTIPGGFSIHQSMFLGRLRPTSHLKLSTKPNLSNAISNPVAAMLSPADTFNFHLVSRKVLTLCLYGPRNL